MEQRGRGRARGRVRPQSEQQNPRPGPSTGATPRVVWGQPQLGTWGTHQQEQPQQQKPPPQTHPQQLGTSRPAQVKDKGRSDPQPGARGAHRGKRILHDAVLKTRPTNLASKKGTTGTPVKLFANYFMLLQQPNWCLFQYRVDFAPDEDHTSRRKILFRTAVKDLDMNGYLFDGTVMYTPRRIHPSPKELFVESLAGDGEKIRITLKLVGDVNMGDYHYIQIFNIIMRKCMGFLNLQLVGRNFYDAFAKVSIPQFSLELWPGYITSIRQHERNILMCCEITHKVMRNETVINLLSECSREDRSNYKKIFTERIIGKVVLTDYNNRTYRVDDVNFGMTPASTFEKKDGTKVTYIDYYRQRYGVNITQKNQPMLLSIAKPRELRAGMSETIILVPELCRMTGLTDHQRSNFNLMQALAEHTRVGPSQRIEKLHNFSKRLKENKEIVQELKQWDLQLANNIVEFAGRVLPTEKIFGGSGKDYSAGPRVDWTNQVQTTKMLDGIPIRAWAVVYPLKLRVSVQKFVQMLLKASKGMSWSLAEPKLTEIPDDKIGSYLHVLENLSALRIEMIMCVVTNNKNDRYSAIKKKCCVDKAIPTQVIVAKNLDNKRSMSIATKIAIQMNCKVGGSPWTVNIPLGGTMVVGYDVCHDPTNKQRSYGAMVASLDRNLTRYFNTASAHTSGEELSNDFALDLIKANREYMKVNGCLPDRIIIYRDGVGDGQLPYVYEHEVETIRKALGEFYGQQPVRMAFIIVSKRINTRIFAAGKNPDPGTVIDDVVTLPERYDFYIVSQCTRQGTVSPTSYNILHDTLSLSADRIQMLTYKLTHMYFNWSGTVRVPAPCQYAHKLAFLVAQSLHRTPNPGLSRLLYYL